MIHVTDDLELFALGALSPAEAARVAAHLRECPVCREQARALDEVVQALPDTLPTRDVPARLRTRILASARAATEAPRAARRGTAWSAWILRPATVAVAALSLAVAVLAAQTLSLSSELRAALADRDAMASIAQGVAEGGRWWYMAGKDEWAGSGGNLIAPRAEGRAPFVVFHDLPDLPPGKLYTVWLVSSDGIWVRGATFRPNGRALQSVDITAAITGFERCAVTVEESSWGRRAGPVVMESRIVPPAAQ